MGRARNKGPCFEACFESTRLGASLSFFPPGAAATAAASIGAYVDLAAALASVAGLLRLRRRYVAPAADSPALCSAGVSRHTMRGRAVEHCCSSLVSFVYSLVHAERVPLAAVMLPCQLHVRMLLHQARTSCTCRMASSRTWLQGSSYFFAVKTRQISVAQQSRCLSVEPPHTSPQETQQHHKHVAALVMCNSPGPQ